MIKAADRFKKVYSQDGKEGTEIWVDTVTGVNYVFHYRGHVEGFTPLLDAEGNPVITPCTNKDDFFDGKKVG